MDKKEEQKAGIASTNGMIKKVLVSQPKPAGKQTPYNALQERYGIKVDFKPFIKVVGVGVKDFRKQKIDFLDFTAVIFTSRKAIDHYFKMAEKVKCEIPVDMKYFCISEQTANYLQKYITVRKRKVFTGHKTTQDLFPVLLKHKTEKYLYPCSDSRKNDLPDFLTENQIPHKEVVLYRTEATDLSDLTKIDYDLIAFFSPSGVESLLTNFPDFKQNAIKIAAFGNGTAHAVSKAGLTLNIMAPTPEAPSMTGAIELFIKKHLSKE